MANGSANQPALVPNTTGNYVASGSGSAPTSADNSSAKVNLYGTSTADEDNPDNVGPVDISAPDSAPSFGTSLSGGRVPSGG